MKKNRAFRDEHDPKWDRANAHPILLCETLGIPTDGLAEYLGEPPRDGVQTAREARTSEEQRRALASFKQGFLDKAEAALRARGGVVLGESPEDRP